MLKQMFAVYDKKTKIFSNPWFSIRKEAAIRDFTYAANDPATEICRYANDYALFYIGSFNDETGEVLSLTSPEHVVSAFTLQNPED